MGVLLCLSVAAVGYPGGAMKRDLFQLAEHFFSLLLLIGFMFVLFVVVPLIVEGWK